MRPDTNGFAKKYQHPLLVAAASVPAAVLLTAALCPEALGRVWVLPALFVPLAWLCLLLPGQRRVAGAVVGTLALVGCAVALLPIMAAPFLLLLPLLYGAALFLLLPVAAWPTGQELPPYIAAGGLAAHLLAHLASGYADRTGSGLYRPAQLLLTVTFAAFLVLALLALNRASLRRASQERVQVPGRMRRQNTALTLGLLLLAAGVALLPQVAAFLKRVWQLLWQGVAAAAAWLAALLRTDGAGSGGAGEALTAIDLTGETVNRPGFLEALLQKLLGIVAVLAVLALAGFLLTKLFRLLRRVVAWLRQRLAGFGSAATKDYVDEITDTREDAVYSPSSLVKRVKEQLYRADESRMTPAQRVRYRYLRLRLRHREWGTAATARDTLPPTAAQLYERARYGAGSLTGEEAQQFQQDTHRL